MQDLTTNGTNEPSADTNETNIEERNHFDMVLALALDLGGGLLSCGAAVSRVEIAVQRICLAYGAAEVNVFSFPSIIEASIKLADGSEVSQMKRIAGTSNNFYKLELLNQLSRDICANKYPLAIARIELDKLLRSSCSHLAYTLVGGSLAAGAFAVFFGGNIWDGIIATLVGLIMSCVSHLLSGKDFNSYASTFILSVIGGVLSIVFVWLFNLLNAGCNASSVIIGTIMLVIPGLLLCNALRDMFAGDLFSGTFELLNSLLLTLSIVGGYGVASFLLKDILCAYTPEKLEGVWSYVVLFAACIVGSTGFTAMFNCRYKRLPLAILNIVVTFSVYLVLKEFVDIMFINFFVPTLVGATLAEIFARVFKAPSSIFMVPSIIVFIPGSVLYYSLNSLIAGDNAAAMGHLTELGITVLAIAVGLIVVTTAFKIIHPRGMFSARHKNRKKGK